jgi:hypothetical protein
VREARLAIDIRGRRRDDLPADLLDTTEQAWQFHVRAQSFHCRSFLTATT